MSQSPESPRFSRIIRNNPKKAGNKKMTDPFNQLHSDPLEHAEIEAGFKAMDLRQIADQALVLRATVASLAKDIPGPGSVIGPEPERVVHNQHRGDVIGAKIWVEQEAQVHPGRYVLLVSELEERMRMVYTPEAGWSDVHRAGTEGEQK